MQISLTRTIFDYIDRTENKPVKMTCQVAGVFIGSVEAITYIAIAFLIKIPSFFIPVSSNANVIDNQISKLVKHVEKITIQITSLFSVKTSSKVKKFFNSFVLYSFIYSHINGFSDLLSCHVIEKHIEDKVSSGVEKAIKNIKTLNYISAIGFFYFSACSLFAGLSVDGWFQKIFFLSSAVLMGSVGGAIAYGTDKIEKNAEKIEDQIVNFSRKVLTISGLATRLIQFFYQPQN